MPALLPAPHGRRARRVPGGRAAGAEGIARSELRDLLSGSQRDRLAQALATLEAAGLAHARLVETGGRPAERWFAGHSPAGGGPRTKRTERTKRVELEPDEGGFSSFSAFSARGGLGEKPPPPDDADAPADWEEAIP